MKNKSRVIDIRHRRSPCPIANTLDILGDKWTLLVIRDLFAGKSTYGDFQASPERIPTNILADRLAKLEAQGVITKTRDEKTRRKFTYRLTEKGADLIPILLALTEWSAKHDTYANGTRNIIQGAPPDLLERASQDRDALISALREGLA